MHQPRSSRFAVQLPISFSGNHGAGSGFVCELSDTGCSVTCEEDIDVGPSVVMHIQLPGEDVPLKADGSIRWTNGMALGMEFHWHRVEEKKRFLRFLNALARTTESRVRRAS